MQSKTFKRPMHLPTVSRAKLTPGHVKRQPYGELVTSLVPSFVERAWQWLGDAVCYPEAYGIHRPLAFHALEVIRPEWDDVSAHLESQGVESLNIPLTLKCMVHELTMYFNNNPSMWTDYADSAVYAAALKRSEVMIKCIFQEPSDGFTNLLFYYKVSDTNSTIRTTDYVGVMGHLYWTDSIEGSLHYSGYDSTMRVYRVNGINQLVHHTPSINLDLSGSINMYNIDSEVFRFQPVAGNPIAGGHMHTRLSLQPDSISIIGAILNAESRMVRMAMIQFLNWTRVQINDQGGRGRHINKIIVPALTPIGSEVLLRTSAGAITLGVDVEVFEELYQVFLQEALSGRFTTESEVIGYFDKFMITMIVSR